MKKIFILIPFLFWGVQQKSQGTDSITHYREDHLTEIQKDTMLLTYELDRLKEESKELRELQSERMMKKRELNRLKKIKQEQQLIKAAEEDFNKFDNRGL